MSDEYYDEEPQGYTEEETGAYIGEYYGYLVVKNLDGTYDRTQFILDTRNDSLLEELEKEFQDCVDDAEDNYEEVMLYLEDDLHMLWTKEDGMR